MHPNALQPHLELTVSGFALIQHVPVEATTIAQSVTLYDRTDAVLLIAFAPNTAHEIHNNCGL
jgi:hypothetical protein